MQLAPGMDRSVQETHPAVPSSPASSLPPTSADGLTSRMHASSVAAPWRFPRARIAAAYARGSGTAAPEFVRSTRGSEKSAASCGARG
jgi:hypothetical protein